MNNSVVIEKRSGNVPVLDAACQMEWLIQALDSKWTDPLLEIAQEHLFIHWLQIRHYFMDCDKITK